MMSSVERQEDKMNITEQIQNLAVVPVVVLEDTEDALPLAKLCVKEDFRVQKLHSVQMQRKSLLKL